MEQLKRDSDRTRNSMEHFLSTKDFLVSGEEFTLMHDRDRDCLMTSPRVKDLAPYYHSENYISHTDTKKGLLPGLYQLAKKISTGRKIKLINRYAGKEKSLLDIGAGTGEFLVEAVKRGYDIAGVEPNKLARKRAADKGVDLMEELLLDRKFQIITLWHVLEHLPDPDLEIKKIINLLTDKGTLFIAVPNFRSYDAHHYNEYWAAYDVPRHIWHFSQKAIQDLFEAHGMEIVETRPMYFDAYYISMLSEKYKSGRDRYLNAIYNGFLSNWKARNTGEYSSLLYIIQKNH
ncbi:MAG: class I SAM-dependent methyltransferase [Flavobacteriaceae bacterium]